MLTAIMNCGCGITVVSCLFAEEAAEIGGVLNMQVASHILYFAQCSGSFGLQSY